MSYYSRPGVVIDNGGYYIKSGFACDNHPVSMVRNVVGRPAYLKGSYGKKFYDVQIGNDAVAKYDELDLDLSFPIIDSRVVHWDNLERLWHFVYYKELKVAPEERAVILSMSAGINMPDKIKACQVFFETLNVPSLCIQSDAVLALYGSGLTTGVTVDLGHNMFEVNPVYEGRVLPYAHSEIPISGNYISTYLKNCLTERGYEFSPSETMKIVRNLRTHYLYLTQKCCTPLKPRVYRMYKLPNGDSIDVSIDAFNAVEMIFQPDLICGLSKDYSLQNIVVNSILKCDTDLQEELFSSIVICGGMSMLPGMGKRLAKEIKKILHRPVNVLESTEPLTLSWLGGATFAGIPAARALWVTRKEYDECGEKVIQNKFV